MVFEKETIISAWCERHSESRMEATDCGTSCLRIQTDALSHLLVTNFSTIHRSISRLNAAAMYMRMKVTACGCAT